LVGGLWLYQLGQVPQLHGYVDAAGGQHLAVGAEGQGGDLGFVRPEADPPEASRKAQAGDRPRVPRQAAQLLAPADVSVADLVVLGGHGDGPAVRRELYPKHQAGKSTEGDPFFAGVQVQNGHRNRLIHGNSTKSTKTWWRELGRGFWGGTSIQLL